MIALNSTGTLCLSLLLFAVGAQAQRNVSPDTLWQEATAGELAARRAEPGIRPEGARVFALDEALLDAILDVTQPEFSAAARIAPQEITVPLPDGSYARFAIEASPVMHPSLAAQFPEIRTYIGRGIDDPSASARFDHTPTGFHAQILKPSGAVYIDPAEKNGTQLYSSYAVKDYRFPGRKAWSCLVQGGAAPSGVSFSQLGGGGVSSGTQLRTYRLAVACTGEYAAFHGGTVALAQAAIVTMVNRVTGIYETELAIRLELVANNSSLVYTDGGSDPFTNNDADILIDEIGPVIDGAIGTANYDIGHVVSTGAGGLAGLGVVCGSRKAEGVTGTSSPINDPFWVDFVAHEIGHQFDGDHTFNGDSGSCSGGNRNGPTAYEPGSGTTIQAYAGICGNDDLQDNSDPYFHSESIDQMIAFVDNTIPGCGTRVATGNRVPTVNAGADYTIPAATPFALTAVGSDADAGDVLTYSWEERDLGPQQDVNAGDNGSSPLFRFWEPTPDPTRTFPRLSDLLNNTTVIGETLPTTTRTMNFRCVVRDHRAGGGGVSSDDMVVNVIDLGAPFLVTFPNTAVTLSGNQTVTWNVAGTTGGGVNTPHVDILLSTDGGLTYPTTLAATVPNDGSQSVTLPNIDTPSARIKVQGAGNIFFDISNVNFTIEPASGLVITPLAALVSSGLEGGPFSPTCRTYTLLNDGGAVLNWQAGTDLPWTRVTPSSGSLGVGGSVQVDVCIEAAANSLGDGRFIALATFTNLANGATQFRGADLTVIPAGGVLQFSATDYAAVEGGGAATILVERSGDTTGAVGVSYTTSAGTATGGSDYVPTSGTLSWGNGDGSANTFSIPIVDDLLLESSETVQITLSSPTGGAELGAPITATLTIADDDSNDDCGNSRLIAGTPFTTTQSTADASSTGDPTPSCSANFGNGVWYHYTASTNGTLTVDTDGSDYDTVLTAFSGGCGSLAELDCDDDTGDGLTSRLSLTVTPGTTYRFLAGGYNSAVGSLTVNVRFVAGSGSGGNNDLCANALLIATTPYLNTQSTAAATSAGDPAPDCSVNAGNGVWYRFTAPRDGFLLVDLSGSSYDTALGIYSGTCGALTQIDCNDDEVGVLTSIVETFLASGTTVHILCAGYEGDTGELSVFANFFGCDDDIVDGDFEGGFPWSDWGQSSTVYGSPLEDSGAISTAEPLSGNSWAWFAGPNTNFTETATLSQTVILPAAAEEVTLRYQLWIGYVEAPFTDTFQVRVDGVVQDTISEPDTGEFFYAPETVDLTAFADGNAHTIEFRYVSPAFGGFADWNVDDVQLKVCLPDFDGDGLPDDVDPDDDNDGIPDLWDDAKGLNAMDPTDAGIDGDGDGASGLEEYVADTSPTNTLSVLTLRIDPRTAGSDEQPLSFDGSSMRDYYIQYRPSLTAGDWLPGRTNIPGAGGPQSIVVTNPAPALIYRIGVNLP